MSDSDDVDSLGSDDVEVKKKRRKRRKNKDPNRPKRNMSAFFLYSNAHRERVKGENPDAKFGDIVSVQIVCPVWVLWNAGLFVGIGRVSRRVENGAGAVANGGGEGEAAWLPPAQPPCPLNHPTALCPSGCCSVAP